MSIGHRTGFKQSKSVEPAKENPGEEVLPLASKAAHTGIGGGTATDCANIPPGAVAEDVLQIRFRGVALRLPWAIKAQFSTRPNWTSDVMVFLRVYFFLTNTLCRWP